MNIFQLLLGGGSTQGLSLGRLGSRAWGCSESLRLRGLKCFRCSAVGSLGFMVFRVAGCLGLRQV